jgi:hypothetical protein
LTWEVVGERVVVAALTLPSSSVIIPPKDYPQKGLGAVAFRFHQASCVVVGTFNIYILRPDWLGAIGILDPQSEVKIEAKFTQPGLRLSSPNLGSKWTVLPDRLILETTSARENCGETIDKVLESLPWTPVTAMGCNFSYRGDHTSVDHWHEKTRFPGTKAPEGFSLKQRTWHWGVAHESHIYNIQLSEIDAAVELAGNTHAEWASDGVASARRFAQRFFEFRKTSLRFATEIFGARIDDEFADG